MQDTDGKRGGHYEDYEKEDWKIWITMIGYFVFVEAGFLGIAILIAKCF